MDDCDPEEIVTKWSASPSNAVEWPDGQEGDCVRFRFVKPGIVTIYSKKGCCGGKRKVEVRDYDVATIMYRSFIHCQVLEGGSAWQGLHPYYGGDGRLFTSSPSVLSRSSQIATATIDPKAPNGSWGNIQGFGMTTAYNQEEVVPCFSCLAQRTPGNTYCDWCKIPAAIPICAGTAMPGQNGNLLGMTFERLSDQEVRVEIKLIGKNPCAFLIAPAIDTHFAIRFRQINCQPMEFMIESGGIHDGFPWHELYINDSLIYIHNPCATGHTPMALFPPMNIAILFGPDEQPLANVWRQVDNPWND